MSVTVTYARGEASSSVLAMRGKSELLITEKDGTAKREHTNDFIIDAADMPTGIGKPAKGDRITDANGVIYQVQNIPGHGAWRWATGQRIAYRVHTQETA